MQQSQFDSIRFVSDRPLLKEVSANRLNGILSEIRRNRPKGERGITVRHSGDGTYIGLAASIKNVASSRDVKPWDIYVSEQPSEGSYLLKVRPGTLATILPSNFDEEFSASNGAVFYGIAKVITDGTFISDLTIEISTTAPTYQEAVKFGLETEIDILFGLFKDGISYNTTGGKNIDVYGKNVISTTAENPALGEPVFDLWFRLQ